MSDQLDIEKAKADLKYRDEMRFRAQTELLWLAKFILGYNQIDEREHREVAEFFVKKDPRKPIEKQDTKKKTRIILLPRRTFNTTFNIADSVQWIIGFPEVAIMAMTASNSPDSPLADAFVEEVAQHFLRTPHLDKDLPEPEEKPLHVLFPEYVIEKLPKAGLFISPARRKFRRDPTLKGVSIEQSLSGWHPDIIKSEDVQDNRNSQTANALKKVRTNFYINIKMLADWSYIDITGTRYGPADLYGHMIQKVGPRAKVLWKPAYIRRPHAMKMDDSELKEKDVILQFPHQLPWEFLRETKADDENSFWTQYMNIAEGNFKPTFRREKLEAAKISEDDLPLHGTVHIAWRFEYADSKNAAAAVGVQFGGRVSIVEVVRDTFKPAALARKVVALAKKWETHRVQIEETPGARNYESHIQNETLEQRWPLAIQWAEFLQDESSRDLYIKSAEPHLEAGRLLFSDALPNEQEVFRQLYHYGIVEENEIPAVVSRVTAQLPSSIAHEDFDRSNEDQMNQFLAKDAYYRIFGDDTPTAPVYTEEEAEDERDWTPTMDRGILTDIMPGLNG